MLSVSHVTSKSESKMKFHCTVFPARREQEGCSFLDKRLEEGATIALRRTSPNKYQVWKMESFNENIKDWMEFSFCHFNDYRDLVQAWTRDPKIINRRVSIS